MKLKNKLLLLVSAVLVTIIIVTGNFKNEQNETKGTSSIIDLEGNELEINNEVNKIISLAPSITSTLVSLQLEDKIIATDTFSESNDFPNLIQKFDMLSPDVEKIITLQPDVIFVSEMSRVGEEDPFKEVKKLGITVAYVPTPNSLEEIKENTLFIGKVTRLEEEATKIIKNFENKINEITTVIGNSNLEKRSVYFEISPSPDLYTFGEGVYLNEILELLNTRNIFEEEKSWIKITEEEVLSRNPQIIFTNTYLEDSVLEITNREGWEVIDAVKNNNVYKINEKNSSQANEFTILAIEEMANAIYPELFN